MIKQKKYITYSQELNNLRDILFLYTENTFKKGNIHHDFIKQFSKKISNITENQVKLLEKSILNSMVLIHNIINKKKVNVISNESLDYFITKTICIYSIYTMFKKL